ncbi:MAG: 16S rRNA (adenine(1518)-N(6)/adenine(1519)-N(6))-dimethyltransferase RsmA [Candidatus Aenigmatarchaeota archaeon]
MDVANKLRELGVKPVSGQNFLNNEHVIEALVAAGEVEDQEVLEIGPGLGAITEKLSEKADKVVAVERDTTLYNHLEEKFEDSNVELQNEDILEYGIPDVDRCVSNLPFKISSEVLERLGKKQVQSALILQKELADRIVADPGEKDYGRLTVMVNYYFIPVKLRDVGSKNYYPSPEVETSIVKLYPNRERHGIEDEDFFFKITRALFTNKMKKARNAFVDSRHILEISKDRAKELRDDIPHSETRVVKLDIRKIVEITEFLEDKI